LKERLKRSLNKDKLKVAKADSRADAKADISQVS
jgi:hypothetical protein